MKTQILAFAAALSGVAFSMAANAATLYVECESFDSLGGWVVDPHSMKTLGSSYVMAHGIGKPVTDAKTTVAVPSAGRYAVWAKTRDWSDEWREGRGTAPGRFRVAVNGAELGAELGAEGRDWHWQKAGEVDLGSGAADVVLHDLTGFNGRCDALVFTDDLAAKPPFARPEAKVSDNPAEYDLAVVGGGMAGICMAQTAVRYGLKVLLLQDREVLGGCNSSEVRVGLGGAWHLPPYPNLGKVVDDLAPAFNNNRPLPPEFYEDARKANFFVRTKRNCDVFYREHVFAVETDPANPKRIAAVLSRNTHTGEVTRHRAALFADATGDATIARLAGCETMYGREERSRFNESCAPEKADRQVMGHSTQWTSRVADAPVPFPDFDWGFVLDESNAYHITEGGWEQEAGQYRDMADDTEAIRDYGLYAVFSNWSYLKNRSPRKAEWAKREITWISPIGGKRESYRVVGDFVLTQNDIENHVKHPDLSAPMFWNIDLHFPDPDNEAKFKEPFRSCAYHRCYNGPYAIPYRCLYARDCDNLFLAGRDISCSHVAFAATRVMGTLGVCGEVAGMAAAVCRKNACMPRDVYEKHLDKLKAMMEKGAPRAGFYHSGGCDGELEFYHFKSDDKHERPQIYPKPSQLTPEQERKIRALGIQHRHEHPQLSKNSDERRCLVLADESRPRLHYYDSSDEAKCFSIPGERPMWDLKKVGDGRYRAVVKNGFLVFDINERRVVDSFRHPALDIVTAVCDLPDGGFVASVNPQKAPDKNKVVLFVRFSKERELVTTYRCEGLFYARSLQWDRDGETLLLSWEKGFARIRLPAEGTACEIVSDFRQPKGRNLFDVVPSRFGGYLAGCGYGGGLVHFGDDGKAASVWFVPEKDGKKSLFYAQPKEVSDGRIYMAHWTGHGEEDSRKGWQVVEFSPSGEVLWHLDDPDRFGSISGIDVLP